MRIQAKEILFDNPTAFLGFIYELELIGLVQLSRPVEDLSGKVMIREKILVRHSMLQRIGEAQDQFKLPIALEITEEIVTRIRRKLTGNILQQIDRPEHAFLRRMFTDLKRSHRPIIYHAFRNRMLALISYRLLQEKPDLFASQAVLGLLCLGIVLQNEYRIPLIHRHAFLSGYSLLLGLADTDAWRHSPESDEDRRQLLERAAAFIDQMGIVHGLGTVLRSSFFSEQSPEVIEKQKFGGILEDFADLPAEDTKSSGGDAQNEAPTDDSENADPVDPDEGEDSSTPESVDNAAVPLLVSTLRIARFARDTIQNRSGQSNPARELVRGIAYNTAKGYFEKDLAVSALRRFKEYEIDIRHLAALATVESTCIHGGKYAWAYPRPRATQVLCSENLLACPHIKGAWTFHLVTPQKAYGRIGRSLPVGTYHKCALEEDLPRFVAEKSQSKKNDPDLEAIAGISTAEATPATAAQEATKPTIHDEGTNRAADPTRTSVAEQAE